MIFRGKTVLVTGASSGIGLAVSRQIQTEGGKVVGISRDSEKLKEAFSEFDKSTNQIVAFDVTNFESYPDFISQLPALDGVVHCAGQLYLQSSRLMRLKDIESVMHPHLFAPLLLTSELLREKKINDLGSVVFLSSTAAFGPDKSMTLYGAAKAALITAIQGFTAEVTPKNKIRFNCVVPGTVETPMTQGLDQKIGQAQEQKRRAAHILDYGQPEDVSELICFLLSEKARWIAGSSYVIDGGALCSEI